MLFRWAYHSLLTTPDVLPPNVRCLLQVKWGLSPANLLILSRQNRYPWSLQIKWRCESKLPGRSIMTFRPLPSRDFRFRLPVSLAQRRAAFLERSEGVGTRGAQGADCWGHRGAGGGRRLARIHAISRYALRQPSVRRRCRISPDTSSLLLLSFPLSTADVI